MKKNGSAQNMDKDASSVANGVKTKTANEIDEEIIGPPIPPDGGYGWVIMIASFFVNVIVDGVCFSFGIFYLEFLDYFGASKSKTSWVGSVLNGMYLGMGPIVGALANKFGCRAVAMVGSLLAGGAFVLSTFSPNINVLIITYGGLGGMGFGLMYLPAIVMVGYYFEKRRAFATGVAVCGSGIGAFIFAPLCRWLLDVYDWKGATWIIAGICLNGVVIGALFRPLEQKLKRSRIYTQGNGNAHSKHALLVEKGMTPSSRTQDVMTSEKACTYSLQDLSNCRYAAGKDIAAGTKSVDNIYTAFKTCPQSPIDKRLKELANPMYRKDIFYSGSIPHLPEFQQSPDMETYVRSVTSVPDADETDTRKSGGCGSVCTTLKTTMDVSLLADPVFLIYGISCFLCMAGFYVPFTYLPPHAKQMGLTGQQGAFLISIIGIANTVARVACGFVSDLPKVDALLLNNLALVMAGIATILCPFCYNYALLSVYSAVFGCGIAVFVSLRSILMVELMGLERLTSAFGLVTMFQGLSAFIGAPLAGALYDATGDYTYSFYMAGGTLFLAGFICFPLRRLNACLKRRQAEKLQRESIDNTQALLDDNTLTNGPRTK